MTLDPEHERSSRVPRSPIAILRGAIEDARAPAWIAVFLLSFHVALAGATAVAIVQQPVRDDDVLRAREIGTAEGRPYRDFEVEYAPVQAVVVRLIGNATPTDVGLRMVGLALAAHLAAAVGLWWGWGLRQAVVYLALATPIATFMFLRFDFVVVAMAVAALAAARRKRSAVGGVLFGLAILAKIWPIVLLPAFLTPRRRSSVPWAVATLALGTIAWIGYGGSAGPAQVATFRGATGWQIESTVGALVWTFGDRPATLESGALRVGGVPPWARVVMLGLGVAIVTTVWLIAWRRHHRGVGVPATAGIAGLLAVSPILSLQYVSWLLPWAALAVEERRGRWVTALVVAASALTGVPIVLTRAFDATTAAQVTILVRNALLMSIPLLWVLPVGRAPSGREQDGWAVKLEP